METFNTSSPKKSCIPQSEAHYDKGKWQEHSNSNRKSACNTDCDRWVIQEVSAKLLHQNNSQQQARGAYIFIFPYCVRTHMADVISDLWPKYGWEVPPQLPSPTVMISALQTLLCSHSKGHHSTGNTLEALRRQLVCWPKLSYPSKKKVHWLEYKTDPNVERLW